VGQCTKKKPNIKHHTNKPWARNKGKGKALRISITVLKIKSSEVVIWLYVPFIEIYGSLYGPQSSHRHIRKIDISGVY